MAPAFQRSDPKHSPDDKPPHTLFSAFRSSPKKSPASSPHQIGPTPVGRIDANLDAKSVQELEDYAISKSEETTAVLNNCLKVAEHIREDATKTLVNLHHQGDQIKRTHESAVVMDRELAKGEKLLSSLGSLFSKTWKPKKNRNISGPVGRSDSFKRKARLLEHRGAPQTNKSRNRARPLPQSGSIFEIEKAKQDDALTDLSSILDQLKDMSVDMGNEIQRQNEGLDHLGEDITELGLRMKGANERGRKLLA